jgi:hypothetical protein
MDILYEEGLQAVLYYKIEIGKDRLNLWEETCCAYENLLEEFIEIRDEDQAQLILNINNQLKSLKEFSENRKLFLWEQEEQEVLKKIAKKTAFQNSLIKKDWDLYNNNRFKNEIISFKNKK